MSDAWKWIDNHMGSIDDDDDWNWFVGNFRKTSFQRELSREKRAAEAKLRDEEDKRYKTAEPNQANASSFAASGTRTMTGVATMPPIFHDHLVPEHVKAHFTNIFEDDPSDEDKRKIDILVNGLLATGTSYNLKSVPETSKDPTSRTVQPHHLDFIATQFEGQVTTERIFKDGVDKNTRRSLTDLGLTGGISNTGSFPEAYFHTGPLEQLQESQCNFVITSLFECKDTAASPDSGHGEGIANATNAAMAMAWMGIPRDRVVVPVFTTTGSLAQVAAVYLLEPSLPTVCFVSKVLQLSEEEDRVKAAKILVAMSHHCNDMEQFVASNSLNSVSGMPMRLETEKYHFKSMNEFFSCFGPGAEGASLTRMLDVTQKLADTPYACLPMSVRLKGRSDSHDAIIFEKLVGYCIGFPHDASDRRVLISEMEKAVADMHGKGVVHMDLYLSNFMWKKDGDAFRVKIIDFDSAHKLGEKLTPATWARFLEINSKFASLGVTANLNHDNHYMKMLKKKLDEESLRVAGQSESEADVKIRLDGACASLIDGVFATISVDHNDSSANGMHDTIPTNRAAPH